jgi:hypothetical protein
MKRRTFDTLMSTAGIVLTVVMIVAGALLFWAYGFANSNVHDQLAQQKIFFPTADNPQMKDPRIGPYLKQYAGKQLVDGAQAEAFANHYIAVHLAEVADGKTYSEVSTLSRAKPDDAALAGQVQTLFRGETLRGLLLNGYAFWKMGQLAKLGGIVAFAVGALMGILSILGFWHRGRVSEEEELLAPTKLARRSA